MAKRLLEKDYDNIALEAFNLPDNDQFKYYLNELENHYQYNKDFIIELEKSISRYKNLFFSFVVKNNLFCNEQGHKIVSDTNNVYVRLPNINRPINRLFFDEQLKIIEILNGNIALRKQVLDFENDLPEPVKTDINKIPFTNSFELSDIKNRFEFIRIKESEFNTKNLKHNNSHNRFWNSNKTDGIKIFRELLLNYDLIDFIDENKFINHFTLQNTDYKINWKDEQTVFIRLFDKISFAINPICLFQDKVKPFELEKHFLIKGSQIISKNLSKTRSEIKGIDTKKEDQINAIVLELKKHFV
jgi:hypothetical protein